MGMGYTGRSKFRSPDGSNYLPSGRIYGLGSEMTTGSLRTFKLVIKNPSNIVHTYDSFQLAVGGALSSRIPDDSGTIMQLQPGQQSDDPTVIFTVQGTVVTGVGFNGFITLPGVGAYQPRLSGNIDGQLWGPVDCGASITVTPVPIVKLMGNEVMPSTGAFPGGWMDVNGTNPVFILSKWTAEKTGIIKSIRAYLVGNNANYGGSFTAGIYANSDQGPIGDPLMQWSSWGVSNQAGWYIADHGGGVLPVTQGTVYWIGIIAIYGPNIPCLGYSSPSGGTNFRRQLTQWGTHFAGGGYALPGQDPTGNNLPTIAPNTQNPGYPDEMLSQYSQGSELAMVAAYGD